jgi:RNA polymerase sigma factor (sigma-70 family)
MAVLKIYSDDLQIAKALINRDEMITRKYFYKQCYPLFKSIYENYLTDCESCFEFINEIYLLVLSPSRKTGKCQLENYRGESTLATWLKTVCIYYCYKKFEKKKQMPICQDLPYSSERDDNGASDRYEYIYGTIDLDFDSMNREDVEVLLRLMPNARYRDIIRMLYLEGKSHKDVAASLGMSMDNYYNKRILAEKQFKAVLRKEANYG